MTTSPTGGPLYSACMHPTRPHRSTTPPGRALQVGAEGACQRPTQPSSGQPKGIEVRETTRFTRESCAPCAPCAQQIGHTPQCLVSSDPCSDASERRVR